LRAVLDAVAGTPLAVGAQNVHWEENGPFTGEVSSPVLFEMGVRFVIVGHSERRALFGETDATISLKVLAARRHGLVPIVCVGESEIERDLGRTREVVVAQIEAAFAEGALTTPDDLVVAYEPVWAIGTGRNATPQQAQEAHAFIRHTLREMSDETTAERVRIQYGGSVKPENARELMSQPDIDGALVGGASLDPRSFAQIVKAARE
jgi:triosephosphate isomerase